MHNKTNAYNGFEWWFVKEWSNHLSVLFACAGHSNNVPLLRWSFTCNWCKANGFQDRVRPRSMAEFFPKSWRFIQAPRRHLLLITGVLQKHGTSTGIVIRNRILLFDDQIDHRCRKYANIKLNSSNKTSTTTTLVRAVKSLIITTYRTATLNGDTSIKYRLT